MQSHARLKFPELPPFLQTEPPSPRASFRTSYAAWSKNPPARNPRSKNKSLASTTAPTPLCRISPIALARTVSLTHRLARFAVYAAIACCTAAPLASGPGR